MRPTTSGGRRQHVVESRDDLRAANLLREGGDRTLTGLRVVSRI
jgi:hypothetical protein